MQRKTSEILVGCFIMLGLAALVMLAFRVGNGSLTSSKDSYTLTAHFDNVGGLSVKAPVSLAGVRIGRVTDISMDTDVYQAVVTMAIESRYDTLPIDSSVSILTAGLLGSNFIGVTPGGDFDYLANGDRFDLTQSAIVLESLISKFFFSDSSGDDASN
ncbi:outer membrane lipid asymmetry maintenance protein MlaD [Gammaproteobacteria bacterium]|nr:outer membrane lipid asymmetry maintenance protein MlaD [Gammaproteobacteria bacterium]